MLEKGRLVADLSIKNAEGAPLQLWDLRNRTHAALIVPPPEESPAPWFAKAAAHQKIWTWLAVKFYTTPATPEMEPGIYAIDRFGGFLSRFPFSEDVWEKLEKEFLYYEAKHC